MANNIKGITVEIGGDTTPLNKALKGANDEITKTQKELKEVNRQLKFDPTNTELVKQKQKLLGDEIKNTKGKLVTLKEAEKQAQDQFKQGKISEEQYRALQREVIKTESQLKNLEKQARNTNSVLGEKFEAAGGKISTAGDKISGVGKKMMPATLAIAGIGGAAVKMGGDYEDSLAKVSTIADTSKKSIEDLSGEVMSLSDKTGTSADEINEALYQAISAGADTEKATGLVEVAVKSAKGGFTDTATAVDGLTSVLNTYGMKTEDADKLANQFLVTQNLGKTTFGELAGSIGKVAPTASAAGVKTNELLSSIAALTANGIGTSESVTGMKAALSNIIKPSKDASDMAKTLGLDFSATALQSKGLGGFMAELKEKTGGNLDTMSKLFGSTEALNTVLTLTSDSGMGTMNKTMQEMETNTTAVDDAFDKVNGTASNSTKKTVNEIKNQAIEIGQMIMPIIKQIIEKISKIVKKFSELSPATKQMILKIALVVAALAPLLIVGGKVTKGIGNLTTGIGFLFKNPMLALIAGIVLAIAGLVIGIKHLWDTNEGFRTAVTNIWGGIKAVIGGVVNAIVGFFTITIPNAWNGLVDFMKTWGTVILAIVAPIFGIPLLIIQHWSVITGFFAKLWEGIKNIFAPVGDWFKKIFSSAWNGIKIVWSGTVKFFSDIWKGIVKVFSVVGTWFKTIFGTAWNGIKIAWSGVIVFFRGIWNGITQTFSTVGTWFTNIFQGAYTGITNAFSGLVDFFQGIWDGITNGLKSALNFAIGGINTLIRGLNKIHVDIPDWVPKIGGNSFGINIPKIPLLAKGGVVDKATLAMLGEAGKEAVVPLENNLKWMKELAAQFAEALKKAIPVLNSGTQVRTAMAAAYGDYPVSSTNSNNHSENTKNQPTQGNEPVTVNQYFQGKTPTPAEHSRQTRNSVKQALLELRK